MTTGQRASAHQRGYGRQWRKARAEYLTAYPLCVMCRKDGKLVRASVVDHVKPHTGDEQLFWDVTNWQSLCAEHHNSTKQREETNGNVVGSNVDGRPIDPNHPWNRGAGNEEISFRLETGAPTQKT